MLKTSLLPHPYWTARVTDPPSLLSYSSYHSHHGRCQPSRINFTRLQDLPPSKLRFTRRHNSASSSLRLASTVQDSWHPTHLGTRTHHRSLPSSYKQSDAATILVSSRYHTHQYHLSQDDHAQHPRRLSVPPPQTTIVTIMRHLGHGKAMFCDD